MMFLVRSAFWLSIVYAHMPLDGARVVRAADDAQGAIVASATAVAKAKCLQNAVSCRALMGAAAGAVLSPGSGRSSIAQIRTQGAAAAKSVPHSANSLSAADLATPWRGRQVKAGA
jgi:hypothetical protein